MIFLMKEVKEEQFLKYKFSSERGDGGKFASAIEGTLIKKSSDCSISDKIFNISDDYEQRFRTNC